MTGAQLASLYAMQRARNIKWGILTRTDAIKLYRKEFSCTFGEALLAVDIAIGDLNEFGVLTYTDPYATL